MSFPERTTIDSWTGRVWGFRPCAYLTWLPLSPISYASGEVWWYYDAIVTSITFCWHAKSRKFDFLDSKNDSVCSRDPSRAFDSKWDLMWVASLSQKFPLYNEKWVIFVTAVCHIELELTWDFLASITRDEEPMDGFRLRKMSWEISTLDIPQF